MPMDDASATITSNYSAPMLKTKYLNLLDQVHRRALAQAVRNILATELAETAYAQILDGLTTEQSLMDSYTFQENDHPVVALNNVDICPGFVDKPRQFRSDFDPSQLRYQPRVGETGPQWRFPTSANHLQPLIAFQESSPGSRNSSVCD